MVSRDLETGIVYSASVFLDEVAVGTITIRNVDASISRGAHAIFVGHELLEPPFQLRNHPGHPDLQAVAALSGSSGKP